MTHADGSTTKLTVDAPTVVVACGSIESPALLLRSGIGGPAVGKHLRLHPAYLVMGVVRRACGGLARADPVAGVRRVRRPRGRLRVPDRGDRHGPGADRRLLSLGRRGVAQGADGGVQVASAVHHGRPRPRRGRGRARRPRPSGGALGPAGRRRPPPRGARAHRAGAPARGCRGHGDLHAHQEKLRWRRGDDLDEFLGRVEAASYEPNDVACFTAHQMGSCRMGSDPRTRSPTGAASCTTRRACGSATRPRFRRRPGSTR